MRRYGWIAAILLLVGCGGSGFATATIAPAPTTPQFTPHTPTPTSRIPFPPTAVVTIPTPTGLPPVAAPLASSVSSGARTPPPIVIATLPPHTPMPLTVATTAPLVPAPSVGAPAVSAGQSVSVKNWDVTVVKVEKLGQTLKTSNGKDTKGAVGQWLVVAVDLSNTGKENFGVNAHDFVLKTTKDVSIKPKDDIGFEEDYNTFRGGLDYNTQVPPGVTVHAFIAFDVGPDIAGTRLEFQGNKQLIGLGM